MTALENALRQAAKSEKGKGLAATLLALMAAQDSGRKTRTKKGKGRTATVKSPEATAERQAAFAAAVVETAKKAGFTDVKPNENIFTYGKWAERGFTVKKGEKSLRVKTKGMNGKGIPLFHVSQVEQVEGAEVIGA